MVSVAQPGCGSQTLTIDLRLRFYKTNLPGQTTIAIPRCGLSTLYMYPYNNALALGYLYPTPRLLTKQRNRLYLILASITVVQVVFVLRRFVLVYEFRYHFPVERSMSMRYISGSKGGDQPCIVEFTKVFAEHWILLILM